MQDSPSLLQKRYKLGFVARISAVFLMASLAFGAVFYALTARELGDVYGTALARIHAVDQIVTLAVVGLGLVVVALLSFVVLMSALYFSFRIAGPVFRLERSFECLATGDLALRIRFRPEDQIKRMAGAYNAMADGLSARLGPVADARRTVRAGVESLVAALREGADTDRCGAAARDLESALDALDASLADTCETRREAGA